MLKTNSKPKLIKRGEEIEGRKEEIEKEGRKIKSKRREIEREKTGGRVPAIYQGEGRNEERVLDLKKFTQKKERKENLSNIIVFFNFFFSINGYTKIKFIFSLISSTHLFLLYIYIIYFIYLVYSI